MKLYEVFIHNGLNYSDEDYQTKLIVAKDETEAKESCEDWMNDLYSPESYDAYFNLKEVIEADGYKILVSEDNSFKALSKQFIGETITDFFCNGFFGSRNYDLADAVITKIRDSDKKNAIIVEVKKTDGETDYGYFEESWRDWESVYLHLKGWTQK